VVKQRVLDHPGRDYLGSRQRQAIDLAPDR
jgi:hypothetical protein